MKTEKILLLHAHTSGINFNCLDITDGYQPVSLAAIVVNMETYKSEGIFEAYIKFDNKNKWDNKAHNIHGLSRDFLENNGLDIDTVSEDFILFLNDHFDLMEKIVTCGINLNEFTVKFLKKMFSSKDFNINIRASIDILSISFLFNKESLTSIEFAKMMGYKLPPSGIYPSSLEFCKFFKMALIAPLKYLETVN